MSFLPPGSEPVTGSSFYFRPEEGENRVRILASPIIGWVGWTAQRKPLRRPIDPEQPSLPTIDPEEVVLDDKNVIRKFWALPIWDYKERRVKVWEIGQATIQGPIKKLAEDADWGDPRRYDLKITRATEGNRTVYTVQPAPKKKAEAAIVEAWKAVAEGGFDLSRLFDGGDPFNPARGSRTNGHETAPLDESSFAPTEEEMAAQDEQLPF